MKIPQGFTVDAAVKNSRHDYMVLSRKGTGYVTVDFKRRCWCPGSGLCVPYYTPAKPLPRQFRRELVAAACQWFLAQHE